MERPSCNSPGALIVQRRLTAISRDGRSAEHARVVSRSEVRLEESLCPWMMSIANLAGARRGAS